MAVKERIGTVVSDKMEKTVVVAVESRFHTPSIKRRSAVPPVTRLTTKTTPVASVTAFASLKPVR